MNNHLTKDDIRNSVAYGWRKNTLFWILGLWIILTVVMFVAVVVTGPDDIAYFTLRLEMWLIVTGIYSVILLPVIVFYGYKMRYLLRHYKQFRLYEVTLDHVSTSYAYKGSVYFTVTICYDGVSKQVCTNPCFSSSVFAKYTLEDYNNKKVIGLYDDKLDKFHIVKKTS